MNRAKAGTQRTDGTTNRLRTPERILVVDDVEAVGAAQYLAAIAKPPHLADWNLRIGVLPEGEELAAQASKAQTGSESPRHGGKEAFFCGGNLAR